MKRPLKEEEKALWARIARTVKPLRTSTSIPNLDAGEGLPKPATPPAPPAEPPPVPRPTEKAKPKPPRVVGDLDRKTRRKLSRGAVKIDGRIDLHGLTEAEAHGALTRFIGFSHAEGRRVVLVITGKGSGGEGRGVLRRSVPHWLTGRELQRFVVSFGPAHQTHGGDGALYVRLRVKG